MDNFIKRFEHCQAWLTQGAVTPPIYCSGGGRCRTDVRTYRFHGLNRGDSKFSFWQYTIAGAGALELEGRLHTIDAGKVMLLTVPEDHCYFLPKESPFWDSIYLLLEGAESARLVAAIRQVHGSVFPLCAHAQSLRMAREKLQELATGRIFSIYEMAAFGYQFLMTVAGELEAGAGDGEPAFLEAIRQAVHADPTISVAKLGKLSGYSKLYFDRVFKRATGQTPSAYLAEQRMNRAVQLLRHSAASVKEIAEQCGFRDSAYFCRAFRKHYGCTPRSLR